MNNPLQFPTSTIVDRLIPKAQFVKASSTPTAIRTLLAEEFEQIRLLYVLRPDTVNVADGSEVKEIDVFLFRCKTDHYSINPFCGIDDLIPRHTIYIIEYGNHTDLLMQHKRRSVVAGTVKWSREVSKFLCDIDLASRPLQIEGQNLDRVYFNFFSQMSGYKIDNSAAITEVKELETRLAKMRRKAENIQKRVRNEKQFNRQIELNSQARALKRQIAELESQLSNNRK
ncbi:DUF4391 family protein [Barnesiella sp. WM24]|uniref:DUF4391 domain-containing protein n=1 Tax=Barnesiella sp. WM24 TaxID=2558278 RepID=UPI0010721B46|nr:DUF4391 domain-containing protein [Barnesiella sp. WM24]TFU92870.1 DUF4391 family protein [Barnesiella sp. WM24]